jgi:hypothetical protein
MEVVGSGCKMKLLALSKHFDQFAQRISASSHEILCLARSKLELKSATQKPIISTHKKLLSAAARNPIISTHKKLLSAAARNPIISTHKKLLSAARKPIISSHKELLSAARNLIIILHAVHSVCTKHCVPLALNAAFNWRAAVFPYHLSIFVASQVRRVRWDRHGVEKTGKGSLSTGFSYYCNKVFAIPSWKYRDNSLCVFS